MITNKTFSSWQFFTHIKYKSELLPKISPINYYTILNSISEGYQSFKGNIVILDSQDKNKYKAIFKCFLIQDYYDIIYNFYKKVDMNNEKYKIDIKDDFLELMFYNNCSNNANLYIKNNNCFLNNNTYNNINNFLNSYFNEEFLITYVCNNCYKKGIYNMNNLISVISKSISLFILFNSILIILFIFILSKIKGIEIGYINDINEKI